MLRNLNYIDAFIIVSSPIHHPLVTAAWCNSPGDPWNQHVGFSYGNKKEGVSLVWVRFPSVCE